MTPKGDTTNQNFKGRKRSARGRQPDFELLGPNRSVFVADLWQQMTKVVLNTMQELIMVPKIMQSMQSMPGAEKEQEKYQQS